MLRSTLRCFTLVTASALLLAVPAHADVPTDVPEPSGARPHFDSVPIPPQCQVGELRVSPLGTTSLIEAGTEFFQLVDVSQCPTCQSTRSLMLSDVFWRLRFAFPCSLSVRVSVVAATPVVGAVDCFAPDPNQVLCQPATYPIVEVESQTSSHDYDLPIVGGCCIGDRAFIHIEVLARACTGNALSAIYANPCTPCTQYIISPTFRGPTMVDQCNGGFNHNYLIWSNAFCCDATPTHGTSWGRLKTIYR